MLRSNITRPFVRYIDKCYFRIGVTCGYRNFVYRQFSSKSESVKSQSITTTATTTTDADANGTPFKPEAFANTIKGRRTSSQVVAAEALDPTDEFEIKDPEVIFRQVWERLADQYDERNLRFPKDIMWLAGAPGAGKGTIFPFIQNIRGIAQKPLETSDLLSTPEAMAIKESGALVSDRIVVELLLKALLQEQYHHGVIVDGFPRTRIQAECIKKLYDRMRDLRRKYGGEHFPRPIFHVTVLFVEEAESVRRQMRRGEEALAHNRQVDVTGIGEHVAVRPTDQDPELARERYRVFKEQVYDSLQVVKEKFHFHFINAQAPLEQVKKRVEDELRYQSGMELGDETFEVIRHVPLACDITENARHEMVERLDSYMSLFPDVFREVINVLQSDFMPIIQRQALTGQAIIRSQHPVFRKPKALDMALDILSERGFIVVLDYQRNYRPVRIDPETHKVVDIEIRLFEFHISFPRPTIRRG